MIDLDNIFELFDDYSQLDYLRYRCYSGSFTVKIWVGRVSVPLSSPTAYNLSLNDYTHFAIRIDKTNQKMTKSFMNKTFGFNFSKFLVDKTSYPYVGYMVPKEYLVKALIKIGKIKAMPIDAGDGE